MGEDHHDRRSLGNQDAARIQLRLEKMDARRDLCTGQKCQQFERCFITEMHRRAHESDIIIVNHHLFFADLAVKDDDFGGIIPEYAAVVFDEAHEIEDVAGNTSAWASAITNSRTWSRDIAVVSRAKHFGSAELDRILDTLDDRSEQFFLLRSAKPKAASRFKGHAAFFEQHGEALRRPGARAGADRLAPATGRRKRRTK